MIKNIILDLGGVLFDINYMLSANAIAKFSTQPDLIYDMPLQSFIDIPNLFEKGFVSDSEFREFMKEQYKLNCTVREFDEAWNKMLIKLNDFAFDFVKSLKVHNKSVVLLSNTNIIHYDYFFPKCKELFSLFDNIFLSYKIGMRKPDIEIYNYVCDDMNFKKNETLFVDDSLVNINGSISAGLNAIHFTNDISLSDILHSVIFSKQF